MIIQSSQIDLQSQRQFKQFEEEIETLNYWHNGQNRERAEAEVGALQIRSDRITISSQSQQVASETRVRQAEGVDGNANEKDLKDGWKLSLLRRLVENLTGKKLNIVGLASPESPPQTASPGVKLEAQAAAPEEQLQGWGLAYNYQHTYHESERTSFSAQGQVITADGRQIDLNIELSMSRSFTSHESIDIRAGDALKDPLVINFSGTAAELEETDLHFDIDLDGSADQMKFVSSGSGFLALDKNGDGQINDGSELFGPSSGDGFAELATYDSDGNNWIDENDAIYEKLRIWQRDPAGNFSLLALGEKGVGAIYLGRVGTEFSVNDSDNNQLGQVRSTGLFLNEDGSAGTVQQLDLIV